METTKFTVEEIVKFARTMNCMSFETFSEMYGKVFGSVSEGYIMEKFNLLQSSFNRWICSLDYETLTKMMKFCLEK